MRLQPSKRMAAIAASFRINWENMQIKVIVKRDHDVLISNTYSVSATGDVERAVSDAISQVRKGEKDLMWNIHISVEAI
jgi:hypothetical protein